MSEVVAFQALPCDTSAPRLARAFVDRRLSGALDGRAGAGHRRGDAAIVVSELVTNAVQAAATVLRVSVACDRDSVRISVYDDADGLPAPGDPGPFVARGRGLAVVQTLAAGWGFYRDRLVGKWVWAKISLHGVGELAEPTEAAADVPE